MSDSSAKKTTKNVQTGESEEEKKNQETTPSSTGSRVPPKINYNSETSDPYRSNVTIMSTNTRGLGKIDFGSYGVQPAPFLHSKNAINTTNETNKSKTNWSVKEVEAIDICDQEMELCGMKPCEVFVPCALEAMDEEIGLLIPGLVREERKQDQSESELGSEEEAGEEWSPRLKISDTCCIVSNGIEECQQLVPLSLARVSNDLDLRLESSGESGRTKHSPQIEGFVVLQHKAIAFAIHLYECPNDTSSTVIEFQKRNGDGFIFQKFFGQCLEKLNEDMSELRNCRLDTSTGWGSLPSLDGLLFDELQSKTCLWDKECLDLLTTLIEDGSGEAVDMLGNLCEEMERHVSLRAQVLQHKPLMEQIITHVLTHQDQCFVSLGLEALHIGLDEEKLELVKDVLRSYQALAFVIALLNSASVFVLRRTIRLLSLLASKCECHWKLSDPQKQILRDCIPRAQSNLLNNRTWSSTYATSAFVTIEMFQKITSHPKM